MAKNETTLTISKARLEKYLAKYCSHYRTMLNSDVSVCDRHLPDQCNLDMVDKIAYACPADCPHWAQSKWKPCEPSRCSYIQRAVKELTKEE